MVNICGKNCGEIEKLLDWRKQLVVKKQNKNSCRILEQGGQRPPQF